jgi:hypothetical protein
VEDTLSDHNYIPQVTEFVECIKGNWKEHVYRIPGEKRILGGWGIINQKEKEIWKQWKDFVF